MSEEVEVSSGSEEPLERISIALETLCALYAMDLRHRGVDVDGEGSNPTTPDAPLVSSGPYAARFARWFAREGGQPPK